VLDPRWERLHNAIDDFSLAIQRFKDAQAAVQNDRLSLTNARAELTAAGNDVGHDSSVVKSECEVARA
jgi:hypothetical protein